MSSPIDLVNQLQKLVVSTYTDSVSDPFQLYKAKHSISGLCLALTRAVQGREEYTALLAGAVYIMESPVSILIIIVILCRIVPGISNPSSTPPQTCHETCLTHETLLSRYWLSDRDLGRVLLPLDKVYIVFECIIMTVKCI